MNRLLTRCMQFSLVSLLCAGALGGEPGPDFAEALATFRTALKAIALDAREGPKSLGELAERRFDALIKEHGFDKVAPTQRPATTFEVLEKVGRPLYEELQKRASTDPARLKKWNEALDALTDVPLSRYSRAPELGRDAVSFGGGQFLPSLLGTLHAAKKTAGKTIDGEVWCPYCAYESIPVAGRRPKLSKELALLHQLAGARPEEPKMLREPGSAPVVYSTKSGKQVPLPKLLAEDFYLFDDVCRDARAQKKKFALIAVKTHACDCGKSCNFCMEETRNLSDRANSFLYDNFARYHLRLARHPQLKDFGKKDLKIEGLELTPGAQRLGGEWTKIIEEAGGDGPGMVILEVGESCKPLGFVPMAEIPTDPDRKKRAAATNESIRKAIRARKPALTDVLRALLDAVEPGIDPNLAKAHPDAGLGELIEALDAQLAAESPGGKAFLEKAGKNTSVLEQK